MLLLLMTLTLLKAEAIMQMIYPPFLSEMAGI
jgi:hypothetical protein